MTDQQHPITPPPELFKQWEDDILNERDNVDHVLDCAWRDGFRAGADQELEACVKWLGREIGSGWGLGAQLHAARRPKPLSLNEVALQMLSTIERDAHYLPEITDTIRRALEALND